MSTEIEDLGGPPFVLIGQPMQGGGVVVLAGEPVGSVNIREAAIRGGQEVTITLRVKVGYLKVRAATYAEAAANIQAQKQG